MDMTEVTKERRAELLALFKEELGIGAPKVNPKPKVVISGAEIVRDAVVRVSPDDPNFAGSEGGIVRVRRNDFVTVRVYLWEEQQRQKREDRLRRREIDPARLGHWNDPD